MKPITNGNSVGSFSLSYSLSDFQTITLQLGAYFRVTEKDMVGISFQNFMIPNSISYLRLWNNEILSGNYQLHINNLLTYNHSPTYELRYAVFNETINPSQSYEVGLGVYSTPFIYALNGQSFPTSFSPILAYRYSGRDFLFQTQYIYNYSQYKTNEILKYTNRMFDYSSNSWIKEGPKLVFENNEIAKFEEVVGKSNSWVMRTINGDSLLLSGSDPYPDCIGCGIRRLRLNETLPSESYKVFWVESAKGGDYIILNIQKAYSDYLEGKQVDLRPGYDYIEQSLKKNRFILDDMSISIGTVIEGN
ncbi:MAG: hypothetical protein LCH54_06000 [Bacteroidetes bacterium]|nr:hypothetical protein [Bacteroidota bacterium]